MPSSVFGLAAGAASLGLLHGLAPGHGWAIAASYALEKDNKRFYGAASSAILGIGHLISSITVVLVYFFALSYFGLTEVEWMNYVAGALLVALGIWQHFNGHSHSHGGGHSHEQEDGHDQDHENDHGNHQHDHAGHDPVHSGTESEPDGWIDRFRTRLPFLGSGWNGHSHDHPGEGTDRGLYGMALLAFALGFAHNEEFDIIAICTGTRYCLELMILYSLAVIVSLVGVTLLLVAGYQRYEQRIEAYTDYLPTITATILVLMGIGFILGVF
jgi:ABC-type nickel/cobalt efflux system permease component RcnA